MSTGTGIVVAAIILGIFWLVISYPWIGIVLAVIVFWALVLG